MGTEVDRAPLGAVAVAATPSALDDDVAVLVSHRRKWAQLPIAAKVVHLRTVARNAAAQAERWVHAACRAKGLDPRAQLAGEEWASGPWALIFATNQLIATLEDIAATGSPRLGRRAVHTRPDGQVVVDVFPRSGWDRLLLSGVSAEVWMQPGVTAETVMSTIAPFYREQAPDGAVALVLGAGNIASIAPLDVLYKMFAEGRVCMLKMNPVNDYLGPIFEDIFAGLVTAGFLRFAYGGVDVGSRLAEHDGIDEIHVTGSNRTHDAIVFGGGPEGAQRRARGERRNPRPVSSELGNVSPTIVVPGPWTEHDVRFQAQHIATQKLHNGGFNCIASQVLVMHEGWEGTAPLLERVGRTLAAAPGRPAYYPGAAERCAALASGRSGARALGGDPAAPTTLITDLDPTNRDEACFTTEAFAGLLAVTRIAAAGVDEFLDRAVEFCNSTLWGTLGANLIVHPTTARQHAAALDRAIAGLRYGCVGVNAWTGVGFLLPQATWGAYPGHPAQDIQSGTGVVHNSLLFGRPQKSVVRAPFRPFPRSLLHGSPTLLPVPPWFVTHRRAHRVTERLTRFEADHAPWRIPGIFVAALRA